MIDSAARVVLIGIGNPFRSDDAVGPAVVRLVRRHLSLPVTCLEETGDGVELLSAWKTAPAAVLVVAVHSGAEPGSIHRFDAHQGKLPAWFSHSSTNTFGVSEAIELARSNSDLPPRLIVFAVEGLNFCPGTELSLEVAEVVSEVGARVLQELRSLTATAPLQA